MVSDGDRRDADGVLPSLGYTALLTHNSRSELMNKIVVVVHLIGPLGVLVLQ